MSNKWFQENKDKFFKKYSDKELIEDIENYKYKNGNLGKIFRHFLMKLCIKLLAAKGVQLTLLIMQKPLMIL